jgi:predicted  nucleic acid-binding Zn-ribbon protein
LKEKNDFSKNAMGEEEEKNVNETSEINDSMVLIRMRGLEEENLLLVETNATHLKHIDAMAIDMSRLQNETVTQRGAITQLERDKSDLETHLLELSSNLSAVQANRIHLEDEMKHLRDKLAAHESTHNTGLPLAQKVKDLEHQLAVNLQLLESRQKLLSQGAEALEVEQQLTAKLKDKIKSLSEQLAATQASERTHKSVNDALQDVIAQGEETIERFQVNSVFLYLRFYGDSPISFRLSRRHS